MQHFAENSSKSNRLQQRVHDITFTLTGSELVALILEEQEVKRLQPEVNRQLRRKLLPFALYHFEDADGYLHIRAERIKKTTPPGYVIIREYPKLAYAKGHLEGLIEEFGLCQHRCGDRTGMGACFNHRVGKCEGACVQKESPESYNDRASEAIAYLQRIVKDSFFLIDAGREVNEKSVVMIKEGQVAGYGYAPEGSVISRTDELEDLIQPIECSRDAQRIVHWYMKEKKMEKVIRF